MVTKKFTRRRFLKTTAAASAAVGFAPYVRTAHAAGKLSVGFWDHWVPGANDVLTKLCNEWAAKEKVEITIDYIPSLGQKNLLTIAAEAQAKAGHDMLAMPNWQPADKAKQLEPVDDVMKALLAKRRGLAADRIPRQERWPLDRDSRHAGQPDQGSLCPHRSAEAARRPGRYQNVSGRRAAGQGAGR